MPYALTIIVSLDSSLYLCRAWSCPTARRPGRFICLICAADEAAFSQPRPELPKALLDFVRAQLAFDAEDLPASAEAVAKVLVQAAGIWNTAPNGVGVNAATLQLLYAQAAAAAQAAGQSG